jgi:PAS domain S-box-containing protein
MPHEKTPQSGASAKAAPQLQHGVRRRGLLWTLLISAVIGGLAVTLLYQSQCKLLERQLVDAAGQQVRLILAELDRLRAVAMQIAGHNHIHAGAADPDRGAIGRQPLLEVARRELDQLLQLSPDVLGITRLSPDGIPLVEAGAPIDPDWWPSGLAPDQSYLGVPVDGRLVISVPVRGVAGHVAGIDLVMFRDARLQTIAQDYPGIARHGDGVQMAALDRGRAWSFYAAGPAVPTFGHEDLKSRLIEQLHLGLSDRLHELLTPAGDRLLALHRQIGQLPWIFSYYTAPGTLFADARRQALFAALVVAALALLGVLLTGRMAASLADATVGETRRLQHLLRQEQAKLDALQASQAQLQAVIDNAPAVIYIKDAGGRYRFVNTAFMQLLSLPREAILGRYDYELFAEDIAKSTRDTDQRVLSTGSSLVIDERASGSDGVHDFLSIKFPLHDQRGEIDGVCGIASDITGRKQVERSLALTQATVDQASVGVIWTDEQGRLHYLNAAARASLSLATAKPSDLTIGDIAPHLDGASWQQHWRAVSAQGSLRYETRFQGQDGRSFPVEVHANHLEHHGQAFYIATVHDISERLTAERTLRQSATVFDCTAEAIVITDADGSILDTNSAFSAILGYQRDEVLGLQPRLWKSGRHDAAFYEQMWRSLSETGEWRGEIVNRAKSGDLVPALTTISAVRNELNEIASYVAIYMDIRPLIAAHGDRPSPASA